MLAENGKIGLDVALKEQPDLILLDMIMPKGLNGRETYEQIINFLPGQKPGVFVECCPRLLPPGLNRSCRSGTQRVGEVLTRRHIHHWSRGRS